MQIREHTVNTGRAASEEVMDALYPGPATKGMCMADAAPWPGVLVQGCEGGGDGAVLGWAGATSGI